VPTGHPLRAIQAIVNEALGELSPTFAGLYARVGRPSIPPEQLLRALLLQAFYSIRSERQLMERLDFDLLFRWFVGLGIDDPVWGPLELLEEPRPAARRRCRRRVPGHAARPTQGAPAPVERALQRRRQPDPGLGQHEELPAEGRQPASAGFARSSQRRGVTPSVLLLKRSGNSSARSRTVTVRSRSE
jgi:Transposase domain (DUF772)